MWTEDARSSNAHTSITRRRVVPNSTLIVLILDENEFDNHSSIQLTEASRHSDIRIVTTTPEHP